MAHNNVEVVLEAFRRFEAFDAEGISAFLHPESQITSPEGWPEPGPFVGRDAVIEQFKRLAADFDKQSLEIKAASAQDDWVVVEYRWTVRGAGSGVQTQFDMAATVRVKDGLMAEAHYRWNRAEALEAAGLPAEGT